MSTLLALHPCCQHGTSPGCLQQRVVCHAASWSTCSARHDQWCWAVQCRQQAAGGSEVVLLLRLHPQQWGGAAVRLLQDGGGPGNPASLSCALPYMRLSAPIMTCKSQL